MRLLFRNGTIIDGTGGRPFPGWVLVEGRKIAAIGEGQPDPSVLERSSPDTEIDCLGCALLPGLINCHVHLAMDASEHPMSRLAARDAYSALLCAVENARKMLMAGFTTVRDCGGRDFEILALRDATASGLIQGPRIVSCGQALLMTGGHFLGRQVDGPADARKAAREMLHRGADFIKVMATGGLGKPGERPGAQELMLDELSAAFGVARVADRTSAAHAHGAEGIRDSIEAGVTSVEHGTFLEAEMADAMAQRGTFLVPTFAAYAIMAREGETGGVAPYMVEASRQVLEAKLPRFRYALEAGVKIAFGTDAGSPLNPHDDAVTESVEMASAGMSSMAVILALTSRAAELLRLDHLLGSLRPGKSADLVLVEGDPVRDLRALGRVRLVVKAGTVVRGWDGASAPVTD